MNYYQKYLKYSQTNTKQKVKQLKPPHAPILKPLQIDNNNINNIPTLNLPPNTQYNNYNNEEINQDQ